MKKDKKSKENISKPEEEKAVEKVKKPARSNSTVSGYNKNDLNSELERLAEMFREELKNQGEIEEDVLRDAQGIIYEDEVCECCGERRKAKKSDYCKPCYEAMKKYPLSLPMVAVAIAVIAFAVFSVIDFSSCFNGYYVARKAKASVEAKEMFTAIDYYDEAISIFSTNGINAKGLKFENVDVMCDVMVASDEVLETLDGALDENEAKLVIYKERVDQYDRLYVLSKTMDLMFDIYTDEAYATANEDDEVYEQAMTAIGALVDTEIVVPSLDGQNRTYKCSEAVVRYCQYTYAYLMDRNEDVYYYVYEVYRLAPDYLCMYGYDLGIVSAQTGDFKTALDVAERLYENNVEDSTSYCIHSIVERLRGNYDLAIEWADKGLAINPEDTELMRNKAMAYVAKADVATAKTIIDEALTVGGNDLCYAVSIVIENELGNEGTVQELKDLYESADLDIPDRVEDYLNGTVTAQEIFVEGTGDV